MHPSTDSDGDMEAVVGTTKCQEGPRRRDLHQRGRAKEFVRAMRHECLPRL